MDLSTSLYNTRTNFILCYSIEALLVQVIHDMNVLSVWSCKGSMSVMRISHVFSFHRLDDQEPNKNEMISLWTRWYLTCRSQMIR